MLCSFEVDHNGDGGSEAEALLRREAMSSDRPWARFGDGHAYPLGPPSLDAITDIFHFLPFLKLLY